MLWLGPLACTEPIKSARRRNDERVCMLGCTFLNKRVITGEITKMESMLTMKGKVEEVEIRSRGRVKTGRKKKTRATLGRS